MTPLDLKLFPEDAPPGQDRLKIALTLTIAETEHSISGGSLKNLELHLRSYGFFGRLDFILLNDKDFGGKIKDELNADFIKNDLISVKLTVQSSHPDLEIDDSATPLTLTGLVLDKGFSEIVYKEVKGNAVLARRYYIRFADAAYHLWRQHYPCELYTNKTLKDVIEAHKPEQIALTYDWTELTTQKPLWFLGHQPGADQASFYDFLLWFVDTRGGVFYFDYQEQKFAFAAEKPTPATTVVLHQEDISGFRILFPEVIRHAVKIHNSYTESAVTKDIDQDEKQAPIRQDYLLDTPVAAQVDARETLEKARLIIRQSELRIDFKRFPSDPLVPGNGIDLSSSDFWAKVSKTLPGPVQGKTLRVIAFDLLATALDSRPDAHPGLADGMFGVQASLQLEQQAEKYCHLPKYIRPHYPRYLEGKIVSEVGADDELTYQIYTDADTSVEQYKIKIPLFANQEIFVPFNANLFPGHYFFPAHKTQRVLVAFDLQNAWLKRFLDWRAEGRLAADTQGNHLLFGKKPTSSTSMKHIYGEDKPEFQILRTHEKDVQTVQIKEGYLLIEVKENS